MPSLYKTVCGNSAVASVVRIREPISLLHPLIFQYVFKLLILTCNSTCMRMNIGTDFSHVATLLTGVCLREVGQSLGKRPAKAKKLY